MASRHHLFLLATATCWASPLWAVPQSFLITDEAGKPVANAAVSVVVKGTKPNTSNASADMGQRNKAFEPTMLVVQTGTAVSFPNFDTVRHHVYSFSKAKTFEIKLYSGVPAAPIVFDKPGTAVMGCNIHDRMIGYVHVVDTPYFGSSDANGRVTIDLPAGEHTLRVWVPSMGEATPDAEQLFKTGPNVSFKLKG